MCVPTPHLSHHLTQMHDFIRHVGNDTLGADVTVQKLAENMMLSVPF